MIVHDQCRIGDSPRNRVCIAAVTPNESSEDGKTWSVNVLRMCLSMNAESSLRKFSEVGFRSAVVQFLGRMSSSFSDADRRPIDADELSDDLTMKSPWLSRSDR